MVYNSFMTRTQIYLPQDLINIFRQRAFEENISVSEAIRRALESCETKKKTQKNVGKILLAMAQDAEKRKIKGPKDLATNLDKYLYG